MESASHIVGKTPAPSPATSGHCHLLSLPPELRNYIYELVCCNIDTAVISIRYSTDRRIDYPRAKASLAKPFHSLALTCHQVHQEFLPMVAQIDPTQARVLLWRTKNFHIGSPLGRGLDNVQHLIAGLPPLPGAGRRTLTRQITLDADFDIDRDYRSIKRHRMLPVELDYHTARAHGKDGLVDMRMVIGFEPSAALRTVDKLEGILKNLRDLDFGPRGEMRREFQEAVDRFEKDTRARSA